jgi:hypothetical protein
LVDNNTIYNKTKALLPKKKKRDINISPGKVGNAEVDKLMYHTDEHSTNLPTSITLRDLDGGMNELFIKGALKINFPRKTITDTKEVFVDGPTPVIFMTNERWGEFSKTWKFTDQDKNISSPFITIRRTVKERGTHSIVHYGVVHRKTFTYKKDVQWDGEKLSYINYKIPQPTPVDLTYEVKFFTKYMKYGNSMDELVFRTFDSRQHYIDVNGHYFPVVIEGMEEQNTVDDIDGDRMYVTTYTLKLIGYLQFESEFEIVEGLRNLLIMTEINGKKTNEKK